MCGIGGYSLGRRSGVDHTLAAQALLAGIAERGADAAGYAHRSAGSPIAVHKQRSGASALLDRIDVPSSAGQALLHVRDHTKGHPAIEANNHPIRHGAVVGVHNGIVVNDEEILASHGFRRADPRMTVDSEAIFALVEASRGRARALEECRGSLAAAWLDERQPELVFVVRGAHRPLWLGRGRHETFFASTAQALELVEQTLRVRLRKRELGEGTLIALADGCELRRERFEPDRAFVETPLPPVRAPHEGALCVRRLAALAAA